MDRSRHGPPRHPAHERTGLRQLLFQLQRLHARRKADGLHDARGHLRAEPRHARGARRCSEACARPRRRDAYADALLQQADRDAAGAVALVGQPRHRREQAHRRPAAPRKRCHHQCRRDARRGHVHRGRCARGRRLRRETAPALRQDVAHQPRRAPQQGRDDDPASRREAADDPVHDRPAGRQDHAAPPARHELAHPPTRRSCSTVTKATGGLSTASGPSAPTARTTSSCTSGT